MKQEVTVRIFNREYRLLTDETKEYTADLAAALNRRLEDLMKGKSTLSAQDGAALIALEACDDLFKTRSTLENIRSQIKVYFDDANNAKAAAANAEKEAADLKVHYERELAALKAQAAKEIAERDAKIEQLQKEVSLRRSFIPEDNETASDMIAKDISKAINASHIPPYNYNGGKK
ncbi:MAG: cell division protein ZapA [Ruminococcus sp.]|nr:cell division protein ZapA [Ruminococcus sp.]